MKSFADSFYVVGLHNAKFFAEDLFRESFASDFPVAPEQSRVQQHETPATHPDSRCHSGGFWCHPL